MGYFAKHSNGSQPALLVSFVILSLVFGAIAALFGGALALLLFAPIFAAIFIFIDYRVGVVLLVVILPFQHTPFLPSFTGFNIVNYLTAASLLSLLMQRYFSHKPTAPIPRIFWWGYLLPIFAAGLHGLMRLNEVPQARLELIGVVYESPKNYLAGLVIKPLFIVLVAWMLGTAVMDSKRPQRLIAGLAIASLLPALAILTFVAMNGFDLTMLSNDRSRGFLSALGLHANEFAFLLGTGFTILLFLLPAIRMVSARFWMIVCLGLVAAALVLTFSRGGYLIAFVSVVAFAVMQKQKRYLIWALPLAFVGVALAPGAVWERATTGLSSPAALGTSDDALTAGRVWIWQQVLPEFWKSPLWGSGVGSTAWSDAVKRGQLLVNHPHNLYLRVLLDVGVLGLALFVLFVRFLLQSLKQISNNSTTPPLFAAVSRGARVALIGVLIAGWSNGNYISESELSILWMAFGLVLPFIFSPAPKSTLGNILVGPPAPRIHVNQ